MPPSPNQPQWTEVPEVTDLSRLHGPEDDAPARINHVPEVERVPDEEQVAAEVAGRAVLGQEGDRFRLLAENASDIIYLYRVRPAARYEYVSPSVTRLTGYTPQEHYDDPDITLKMAHPHDRPLLAALIRAPGAFDEPVLLRLIRKDGSVLWTEHRIAAIYDATANVVAIEGIARDITERRETEDELWRTVEALRKTDDQRRKLLTLLAAAEQKERKQLAEDLHDDSIQVLTAAVLRLQVFRRHVGDDTERVEELDQLEGTLRHALERLRHVSFELRPPTLDSEGLIPALRVFLEKLREDSGIRFDLVDHLDLDPPLETRITAYRITQEALVNVRKHADAQRVHVLVEQRDHGLMIRIQDDGRGFDLSRGTNVPGHLGLVAMRERAELGGGWWKCRSAPGAGTTVEFWLPREVSTTPGSGRGPGA
jgi:PAS domain S-box-containing protein